jgi:hypothetical protein
MTLADNARYCSSAVPESGCERNSSSLAIFAAIRCAKRGSPSLRPVIAEYFFVLIEIA